MIFRHKILFWILGGIFLLSLVSVFLQSSPCHSGNAGNVFYLEKPVFFQTGNPITQKIESNPNRNGQKPESFMSQDAKWSALWTCIGAFLAVLGGIFQSWWQGRSQAKDAILDDIVRISNQIEMEEFAPKTILMLAKSSLSIPITRLEHSVFCWNKKKVSRWWAEMKCMDEEKTTKDEIKKHIDELSKIVFSTWT